MTTPSPSRSLLESRLASGIAAARWFAAKGRRIDGLTIHDSIPLPGTDAILAIVDIATADGGQRYAAVPATAPAERIGADAAGEFARWLAAAVAVPAERAGERGRFVVHAVPPPLPPRGIAPAAAVAPLGGDASNSSFVVRDPSAPLAVKLVRRCRPGIQPEVEVGRFFATASPWNETPRLRGWLEYVPHAAAGAADEAAATVIATVHDFVPGCTTAWESLLGLLVTGGPATIDRIVPIAAAIGRTTARMHAALAARPDVAAFAPHPATAAGRRRLAAALQAHAEEVLARVGLEAERCEEPLAARLASLASARGGFGERFDRLGRTAAATGAGAGADIRVHGDYHLGQVLLGGGPDGVLVIDFEGEPGRPLDERRAHTSAAKDVAGMCRSFDYLLRQAAKGGGPAYDSRGLARLEGSFLDAYRTAANAAPWWPAAGADELVEAYRLDKALYELAYEIDNRPDWVDVPLAALLAGCG